LYELDHEPVCRVQASQLLWFRVAVNVQLANLSSHEYLSIHQDKNKVDLFWGGDHSLEFAQEDLSAHHGVEFLDALSDFLRRELLDSLDQNLYGVGSAILNPASIEKIRTDSLLCLRIKNTLQFCALLSG